MNYFYWNFNKRNKGIEGEAKCGMGYFSETVCHNEVWYCTISKLTVDAVLYTNTVAQRGIILEYGTALEEDFMSKQNTRNVIFTVVISLNWTELYWNA